MRPNESGMTLVELVVILAIIAILAVATYSGLGGILEATKAKGGSEQLAGAIRVARQYAITRGNLHCIEIFPTPAPDTGSSYRIREVIVNPGPPITYNCGGTVVDPIPSVGDPTPMAHLAHGQAMVTPANQVVVFDPLGAVKNFPPGNPSVTLVVDANPTSCPKAPPVQVFVSLYGGVRVSTGTC